MTGLFPTTPISVVMVQTTPGRWHPASAMASSCLLYTSDAADERSSVDLGGRRIIKKKKGQHADAEGCV